MLTSVLKRNNHSPYSHLQNLTTLFSLRSSDSHYDTLHYHLLQTKTLLFRKPISLCLQNSMFLYYCCRRIKYSWFLCRIIYWPFGLFLGHGLPDLLPPTFALLRCRLPVPCPEQFYGMSPTSILPSTSRTSHRPASSETSLLTRWRCENYPLSQPTVVAESIGSSLIFMKPSAFETSLTMSTYINDLSA